jgi:hypothetical protein
MPSLINDAPRAADDPTRLRGDTSLLNGDPLRGGAPTLADAYSYNAHALADWVAAQRAESAQRGLWDEARGAPTTAGARDAAMQVAQGVALASTAPKDTPGLLGRASMGRMDPVQHILDHVSSDPNSQWGIRVTDDPIDLSKGVLPPSRIWDDGKPTDQVLGGTSTVGINGNNRAAVERALADAGIAPYGRADHYYPGQHVTLVKGDYAGGGDDAGEALIRNATPVATYQKMDDGSSALMPVAPATPVIRAFHGSPHDFEAFDASKIGTGEGAQAYGHGLYVAESQDVAQGYRDRLSTGSPAPQGPVPIVNGEVFIPKNYEITQIFNKSDGDPTKFVPAMKNYIARNHDNPFAETQDAQTLIDAVKDNKFFNGMSGRMYEVEIAADPQHFLDWDKPLSEQGNVGQIANQVFPSKPWSLQPSPSGKTAQVVHPGGWVTQGYPGNYSMERAQAIIDDLNAKETGLARRGGDLVPRRPEDAAALREAGIPGIKYLDAGSRGAGEGSSNYVIFDPKLLKFVRKYAVPAFATAGGIPAAMGGATEQQ